MKQYCNDYLNDNIFIDIFSEKCEIKSKDIIKILKYNKNNSVKFIQMLDTLNDKIDLSDSYVSKKIGKYIKKFSIADKVSCFMSLYPEIILVVNFIQYLQNFINCFPYWNDDNKIEFYIELFKFPEYCYFLSKHKDKILSEIPLLDKIPKLGELNSDVESDADENGNLKDFIEDDEEEIFSDIDNNKIPIKKYIEESAEESDYISDEDNKTDQDNTDIDNSLEKPKSDDSCSDLSD